MIRLLTAFAAGALLSVGVFVAQRFTADVPDSPLASPEASAAARAIRETMALPTTAALATPVIAPACSGVLMPNPIAAGLIWPKY